MASSDLEKRVVTLPSHDNDPQPSHARSPRRPILHCLALLLSISVLLSIAATSHRCYSQTWLFTNHAASQSHHVHHDLSSPKVININSRSPNLLNSQKTTTTTTPTTSAAAPNGTVLKTFEVAQPVLMPDGPAESDGSTRRGEDYEPELCTVLLMRHDFAWSYDRPFVGDYNPPDCEFNRVVLNFSVVSQGRQYDRLAIMYFGDTEVWRTSTAEPTAPPGISWIYLKDMTEYMYFWKSPQKIIFDLGNLINDQYTGIFNTTMTAIFYNTDVVTDQAPPSDLIIPISARHGANNSVSRFSLPADNATNTISLPQNIHRAVFSVSANGQASEEFWWSNVPETDVYTFNATAGPLPGLSPFREVQVLIDGQLAGVQWPFPVIFTGGVVPSLHRPIVGIHAFDLREHEIDVTPFIPLLSDGQPHSFTIRVAGLNTTAADPTTATLTETVNEAWYVTGKLFLWLDSSSPTTTNATPLPPSLPTLHLPRPTISLTRSLTATPNGTANSTLTYTTSVHRRLQISSGSTAWSQSLSYTNNGLVSDSGYTQLNDLLISGVDNLASPTTHYHTTYRYPLFCNSTYSVSPSGELSIWAYLRQGKEVDVTGAGVFATGLEAFGGYSRKGLTRRLWTRKDGTAGFWRSGDGMVSKGWGDAGQRFWFGVVDGGFGGGRDADGVGEGVGEGRGRGTELYFREVEAVNGTLVRDWRRMEGRELGRELGSEAGSMKEMVDAVATEYA